MHENTSPFSHFSCLNKPQDDYSEWINLGRTHPHPQYDDSTTANDYMIVVLDEEVSNPNIEYVTFANKSTTLVEGDELTVIGYGLTDPWDYTGSDTLQKAEVNYFNNTFCDQVYGGYGFDPDSMFCAGVMPQGGVDSCQGDSGKKW